MAYLIEAGGVKVGTTWRRIRTGKLHKVVRIYQSAPDVIVITTKSVRNQGGRGGMFTPREFTAWFVSIHGEGA